MDSKVADNAFGRIRRLILCFLLESFLSPFDRGALIEVRLV